MHITSLLADIATFYLVHADLVNHYLFPPLRKFLVGIKAQSEYSTSHGRIDLIFDLPKILYVVEIKFNESAETALAQIKTRRYYEPFLMQQKSIILLGLSFKREPSNFDVTYAIEKLEKKIIYHPSSEYKIERCTISII
jgi:Holliday junction resolvase-like predicted endonuclease